MKAARIIHNNSEQTIYYEDATIEFFGVPVAYMPYFWAPDPTVKRKTGFLAPRYVISNALGYGASMPFFWAIAPNYDLTLTPTYPEPPGLLGQAEWRHRLVDRLLQHPRRRHLPAGHRAPSCRARYGRGDRDFRGSLEIDRPVLHQRAVDVGLGRRAALRQVVPAELPHPQREHQPTIYFGSRSRPSISGQGDRSWFDVRGYYFRGLSTYRLAEAAARRRIRCSTTTSASTARRSSAARSRSTST